MNFIEIFRKYDKVVESFVRKTKSKSTRDIIDVADKYVTKDKEILRQLKEFIKQDGHEEYFGFKEDLPGFCIEQQNDEGEFEEWVITELNLITSMEDGNMDDNLGEEGSYVEAFAENEDYSDYVTVRWEELDVETRNQILYYLNFTDLRYDRINESFTKRIKSSCKNTLKESFTKKISSKKNTDLVPDIECPDGVYILHETLGVKDIEEWNPKDNDGVVGILVVEDDHKIVVALEDSPENLQWSKDYKLVNRPADSWKDAESDFNGEEYCRNLNSPDFPAAYYCLNYNKGGRDWYLPSMGELWLICKHLEEIQTALSIVGGQEFVTEWDDWNDNDDNDNAPWYWSSTENSTEFYTWLLLLDDRDFSSGGNKVSNEFKVRPVSNFRMNTLKESFTKKIKNQTSKNVIKNADNEVKMASPLTFEDDKVSNIFFNEVVDVEDYEGGVYTLGDASVDSHVHDGYSEYFPFDDYLSNSWRDKNIVRFHELCFFTGLKKLPEYAFVNCTSLEEVTLPDNLEEIEQGAFANCTSLKTVRMPKNRTLRYINDSAFANTGLVSVVIPDGVEVIGECAFADCDYLESVVIPISVKKIERGAFSRCRKLKSVSGIESVQDVGRDVFYGCGELDSSVFGKFVTLREFDKILFSGDWINDSDKVRENFLESYCLNHYDMEDYKHITDKEWEEDEFNPDSPNFNKERFYEKAWDYATDDVSWEWNVFEKSIKEKFQGSGGWITEDEERFSDFSSAFSYCIPNNCDWQDLEVKQDGGSIRVCGTEIVPECDRYIDGEIDEIYPDEFIDYNSLRFCDPIEKEIDVFYFF